MKEKRIVATIFLRNGIAVKSLQDDTIISEEPISLAVEYNVSGADELLIFDFSDDDASHEKALDMIKEIVRATDIPVIGAGNIKRLEDVKKLIYAGCKRVALNFSKRANIDILEEAGKRFGPETMLISAITASEIREQKERIEKYASEILLLAPGNLELCASLTSHPMLLLSDCTSEHDVISILKQNCISAIAGEFINENKCLFGQIKEECIREGMKVRQLTVNFPWQDFKQNSDGMLPVVIQDYLTDELLMVAYMNEEAYRKTIQTGIMHYFSRSRQELWLKGATSGHYQYVKALYADCDKDTLLAKVHQIGSACHTGKGSCFYEKISGQEERPDNPKEVLWNVYQVIEDRKKHPKEGSYTNYLFDKGIDKILKKVGEEATELVIAAKNPNPEEIKYELSDFLYHAMVLMVEKGITWDDILGELANR